MKNTKCYILDLRNVKCPMNLVLTKQAVFEEKFKDGGQIIIDNNDARQNIISFLKFKKIRHSSDNAGNIIIE